MKELDAVLNRIDRDLDQSIERLFSFLKIQSISTDPAYKSQCRAAAEFVAADLKSIGFAAELRTTEGHPIVVGKAQNDAVNPASRGRAPHVLFYGHYDVQPVDPLELWTTPPFEPRIDTLPDGRKIIVARGACDDKGQAMTFVEACRAYKAVTGSLPLPITMMIEGEEECGSKNLFPFVRDNADEFKLDLALVCDTGMWNAETPSITTSLRGLDSTRPAATPVSAVAMAGSVLRRPSGSHVLLWLHRWRVPMSVRSSQAPRFPEGVRSPATPPG